MNLLASARSWRKSAKALCDHRIETPWRPSGVGGSGFEPAGPQPSKLNPVAAGSLRLGEQENQVVLEIRSCPLFRERRLIRSIRLRCCDAFLHNRTGLKRYNLVPRNQDFSTGRGITPFAWTFRTNDKNTEAGNFYWFAPFQKGFDDLERALDKIGRILF